MWCTVRVRIRGLKIKCAFYFSPGLNKFASFRFCSPKPAAQERLWAGSGSGRARRPPPPLRPLRPSAPPSPLGTYKGVAHH